MAHQIKQPDPELAPDLSIEDIFSMIISNKFLEYDRDLYSSKWWDYRFMSPCEATMLYIDAFGQAGKVIYARELDCERAEHVRYASSERIRQGLLSNDDKSRKSFAAFWRGRQVADAIGMPYDVYCHEAIGSRMRAWQRTYLPSANHIYRDRDVEFVAGRWEQMQASKIYYADHHAYLAQNHIGTGIQLAYCEYLVARAQKSTDPAAVLASMVDSDRLPLEYLIQHLPSETLDQVRKSLR